MSQCAEMGSLNLLYVFLQVAKLGIRDSAHFSLVVEHIKSLRRNKLTILDPTERLAVVSRERGVYDKLGELDVPFYNSAVEIGSFAQWDQCKTHYKQFICVMLA